MSADDPRWRKVFSFDKWLEASNDVPDMKEFLQRWEEYTAELLPKFGDGLTDQAAA
jgi:hypothetical protein